MLAYLEGTCYFFSDKQYADLVARGITPILCTSGHDAVPFVELKAEHQKRIRRRKLMVHVPIFVIAIVATLVLAIMGSGLFAIVSSSAITVGTVLSAGYTALGALK